MKMVIKPRLFVTKEEMNTIMNFLEFLDKMTDKEYDTFIEYCGSEDFYHTIENLIHWAEEE